jgi:hypothetical protein
MQGFVPGHQWDLFDNSLGDQHAIEWVAVDER